MAKVGIIGTGWGTRVQVPRLRAAGLEIKALYGRHYGKAREMASRDGIPNVFEHWQDLIRSDIDLVTIVTPPFQHLEMATAALEAGLHIVTEKPTAMNAAEALQILNAGRNHPDQIALIDHELRFLPSTLEARRIIPKLGKLHWIECRYSSPSRNDPARPWSWWADASKGGGVLGAVGSHLIDAIRNLAGEIASVSATLDTFIETRPDEEARHKPVTSDDFATMTLHLASGAVAVATLSVVSSTETETSITIHGRDGGLRLVRDRLFRTETGDEWEEIEVEKADDGPGDSPGGSFGSGTYWLGRALVQAIDEGNRAAVAPGATLFDGYVQQLVLDAARRSAAGGSAIEAIRIDETAK